LHDEYYYGVFWSGMPDLNYRSPALLGEMEKVAAYWVHDMGADGLRMDAVPYLVEDGNVLAHSSGTHEVLRQLDLAVRTASPSAFTIGEVSETNPTIVASYYPNQLDSYFAFGVAAATLNAARTGSAAEFLATVQTAQQTFPAGRWAPFLTNHDQPRVMTQLKGDVAEARVAAIAMLTLPGTPFVYYGEEIGMRGDKPDEQIRTPMQWSAAAGGGFTTGAAWEVPQTDWRTTNVAAQDGDPASLLTLYRQLIHLRADHAALRGADLSVASANDKGVAAYVRHDSGETALVVLNFSGHDIDRIDVALDAADCAAGACRLEPIFGAAQAGEIRVTAAGAASSLELSHVAAHQGYVFQIVRP
jgi:glycosidase